MKRKENKYQWRVNGTKSGVSIKRHGCWCHSCKKTSVRHHRGAVRNLNILRKQFDLSSEKYKCTTLLLLAMFFSRDAKIVPETRARAHGKLELETCVAKRTPNALACAAVKPFSQPIVSPSHPHSPRRRPPPTLSECESAHPRRTAPYLTGQRPRQMAPLLGTAKETGIGAPPWGKTLSALRLGTEYPQRQIHEIHDRRRSSSSRREEGRREKTR